MYNVAVVMPSRGLMFSRTVEEVLRNLKGIPHKFYFAHRKPIPECFEEPTARALKAEHTHIWYVEDDMILHPDILKKMLDRDLAVVTVNYPTTKSGKSAVLKVKGQVIYGGTGCTLVKRAVFDELKAPYFRDDIKWIPKNCGDYIRFTAINAGKDKDSYGFHDVYFFMNLLRKEIPVHEMDFTIGQRKLKALGKADSNNGAHQIEEWFKVKDDDYFEISKKWAEVDPNQLIEIIAADNSRILAKPDHAERLIEAGLASKAPRKAIVIDDSEIL